jgi:hypothetical protein
MVDWKRTEEGEDFWEDVYDGRFEDAYNYIKYHGEKKGLDEYGRGKYDRKVGTYKGKYPIYQDDEGNNYIKTGSGIKDVEDLDQSQVKINKLNENELSDPELSVRWWGRKSKDEKQSLLDKYLPSMEIKDMFKDDIYWLWKKQQKL